jgi:hypothetical protein
MGSPVALEAGGEVILTWEFVEAPNRRFYWRAIAADGSVSQQSPETFPSLDACAADVSRMLRQSAESQT